MGGYIGYIIGVVIILPLLLIAYNHFLINKNDAKKVMDHYMKNSEDITLTVPDRNIDLDPVVKSESITIALATKNMGRDGSSNTSIQSRFVYDTINKKYFKIVMFDLYNDVWIAINKKTILARVNKQDLANPKMGSKEKPILVFSVRGVVDPLMMQNLKGVMTNYNTTQEQYEYNVFMYLTYVMSKKEFKDRFEKGK
ncbi:hypothetical protein [Pedobacter cryoconitis]|uniref:DUF8188 domain-containing protein n=1 Tax=Pedobacter cryoconitis TaxID=188932 RepID=A0A327RXX7_9SPHI|nr:hypothetical protein [Pedobacter cryoconitis]RAJ20902.1 hypothetical protein LY11_05104 [Pedobacter cryoconitis]